MENQTSSKQIMLNYGIMLGAASILLNVITYTMGMTYAPHWSIGLLGIAIMIGFIVMGIKKFKEFNKGLLSLGEALKTGVGIALIAGVVGVIYTLLFTNFIEPDYFAKMQEVMEQTYIDAGLTDEQIEASMAIASKMSGPTITAGMSIIGSVFLGFIFSLIGGLVMKHSDED